MNKNISDKDIKDWEEFINSKDKIHNKDVDIKKKNILATKTIDLHGYTLNKANEIIALNKKGVKISSLEDYVVEETISETKIFENVVGQDSLTRFDKPKSKNTKKRNSRNRNKSRNKKSYQNKKSKKNV